MIEQRSRHPGVQLQPGRDPRGRQRQRGQERQRRLRDPGAVVRRDRARLPGTHGRLDVQISDNNVADGHERARCDSCGVALNFNTVCARINGNTTDAGGAGFTSPTSPTLFGIFAGQANTAVVQLDGWNGRRPPEASSRSRIPLPRRPALKGRSPASQPGRATSQASPRRRVWPNRFCPRSGSCPSASRRKAGRSATGSSCRINQNQALFSLLGTTYGGDGRVNFALPDLRGRAPIHMGSGHTLGERGGEQAHTLSIAEIPTHTHAVERHRRAPATTRYARRHARARAAPANQLYRAADATCVAMTPATLDERRRQPGAPEHAAVPGAELLHRPAGHLPVAELEGGATMAQPYVGEIRMFAGNFAPAGWMFCEGQLLPISEIRDAVQPDRHDLRRRRPEHLRPARPARPHPAAPGQRLHPGRDRRRRGGHADRRSRSRRTRTRCWRRRTPATAHDAGEQRARRRPPASTLSPTARDAADAAQPAASIGVGRRQPAARQLPAVPLRRLHHLAVRDLPVPDLGGAMAWIHSSPRSASSRSTSRPKGWAFCDGQLLPLSQNTALFSLLGTTYGGDGKSQLRAARPAGQRADAPGPGPGPLAARPRRDRRQRDRDAARVGDPPTRTRCRRRLSPARIPRPARSEALARSTGANLYQTQHDPEPRPARAGTPSGRPAAASRTTTCSRT